MNRRTLLHLPLLALPGPRAHAAEAPVYRARGLSLYQPDDVVKARLGGSTAALASYVHGLSGAARTQLSAAASSGGASGAFVAAIRPGRQARVWLVLAQESMPQALREALIRALSAVAPPEVRDGPLALALLFDAWGGGGTLGEKPPIPREWRGADGRLPPGPLPEAALALAWP